MTASLKASSDGTQAIIQVGGVDKVTIGAQGIEAGSFKAGAVAPVDLSQKLTLGTSVVTTSGTAIDITNIPSWVKRITVVIAGVSTNGTSSILVQLRAGGVAVSSGYLGSCQTQASAAQSTTGFMLCNTVATTTVLHGTCQLALLTGNSWVAAGVTGKSDSAQSSQVAGSITLGTVLEGIRLTTVNGTDTFDAGSINILYE